MTWGTIDNPNAEEKEREDREFRRDISRIAWKLVVSVLFVVVLAFLIDQATDFTGVHAVVIAILIIYGSALLQTWVSFWARKDL